MRPIAYNWEGKKLSDLRINETYEFRPFGPHSPAKGRATLIAFDEEKETATFRDKKGVELTLTFDDYDKMYFCPVIKGK